jgi:hypothetical protein
MLGLWLTVGHTSAQKPGQRVKVVRQEDSTACTPQRPNAGRSAARNQIAWEELLALKL